MNPDILPFRGTLLPSIANDDSFCEVLNLRLDILLDDGRKSLCVRDGRELQACGQSGEWFEPAVEGGICR